MRSFGLKMVDLRARSQRVQFTNKDRRGTKSPALVLHVAMTPDRAHTPTKRGINEEMRSTELEELKCTANACLSLVWNHKADQYRNRLRNKLSGISFSSMQYAYPL